jgi:hypothetical protein
VKAAVLRLAVKIRIGIRFIGLPFLTISLVS